MPKGSAVINHLLLSNHSPSFESFSVLAMENRKFVLELKERKYPNNERYTFFKQKDHVCIIIPIRQSIANVNFVLVSSILGFLKLDFGLLCH